MQKLPDEAVVNEFRAARGWRDKPDDEAELELICTAILVHVRKQQLPLRHAKYNNFQAVFKLPAHAGDLCQASRKHLVVHDLRQTILAQMHAGCTCRECY